MGKGHLFADVRWARRADCPSIAGTEALCYPEDAWTPEYVEWVVTDAHGVGTIVADVGTKDSPHVIGHMTYEKYRTHFRIINVAVSPRHRRQRIGTQLLWWLVARLDGGAKRALTLTVRERALEAQLFFRANGFKAVKVLRWYYKDLNEDGYYMRLALKDRVVGG